MKQSTRKAAVVLVAATATGCASSSGWTPTVDPAGSASAASLSQDQLECRQLAQRAAGNQVEETGRGVLGGGALGAASGAIIGGIGDDIAAGSAAGIGAAVGALAGGATKAYRQDQRFKEAYTRCMEGRGHRVL